jgi:hypothetical protein
MNKNIIKKKRPFMYWISALLFLALSGCVDLKAIRSFSEISSESATYRSFTDDYVGSMKRQKNYQSENNRAKLDTIIKIRESQCTLVMELHKEVFSYMKVLGELSSDEIISYDKSFNAMVIARPAKQNENGGQYLKKEQIDAFNALAKLLAKATSDSYRKRKLKEIIASSNKDFMIVIGALKNFIESGYIESLTNERIATNNYYQTIINTAIENPPQHAAIAILKDMLNEKIDGIDEKKHAAELYVKILNTIGEGHQFLYDKRSIISSKQTLFTIRRYGNDISTLYNTITKLK